MNPTAICFGEILFDVFGDEHCIGGAPFNFAAHFAQLGGEVAMVSAVGDDELGHEALDFADQLGIGTSFIACLPGVPTGRCNVTLENGTPSYDILRDVAYDRIPVPALKKSYNMIYFGTLSQRSSNSTTALDALLYSKAADEAFFDVNIRKTSCDYARINKLLEYTTILKFSREEAGVFGSGELTEICRELAIAHKNIKLIIVTLDKDGAFVYDTHTGDFRFSRRPRATVVSTVGAGDGFSARFMYDYLQNKTIDECIENATRLAERICAQKGAI